LYALNRVGLFSDDDFKLGGGVLNQENEWLHQVELRNDEISELKAQLSELNIQLGDVKHRKEQAEIIAKKWYNLMEQCRKQGVDINDLTKYFKERNEEL
jgi:predicted metal-binding transcription factor (methanogenesis marker protein 9)